MTQVTLTQPDRRPSPGRRLVTLFKDAWSFNKPLTLVGIVSLGFLAVALLGLAFDPTRVLSEPAWLKPAKFAISITLYSFTFLWLLTYIRGHRRLVKVVAWTTAIAFLVEMVVIGLQATRGVRSHFNVGTPLDAALFSTMGSFIFALWLAGLVAAVLLLRQDVSDRVFGLSLKLGLLIGVLGAGIGALMTTPTEAQLEQAAITGMMTTVGAHTVGAADGGEGLPLVGWSTEGGDLRVAHFLGLHAMQIIPLVGFLAVRRSRLTPRGNRLLIWAAAAGYAGLTALTLWQALRGQPLLRPDTLTLIAASILIAGVTGLVLGAVRIGRGTR